MEEKEKKKAGRKSKYGEKSENLTIRVPLSKKKQLEDEFKKITNKYRK